MILFIGQVAADQRDREAFQEVDYRAMFTPLAKRVLEINDVERIPEYVSHAFHVAQSGRPGPVVVSLPESMLSAPCDAAPVPTATLPLGAPSGSELEAIITMLDDAKNPFAIVGGGCWSAKAAEALGDFAEKLDLPIGAAFRCQDYLDNRHPCYAGDVGIGINPALSQRIRDADVLLCLGPRLGEMTTSGYTLIDLPVPKQKLVHVHPDANEPGRVFHPKLSVAARPDQTILALAEALSERPQKSNMTASAAHADYKAWQIPVETPGALKMEKVISHLNAVLPEDAILTNGAGNYAGWLHRYYCFRSWRTQLAPTSGSMGYGLPAAVSAKLEQPKHEVICLAGDGCFQMTMQEFGTAAEYGANIIVLVVNNGHYGTIRMHQQQHYPKRPSGTQMKNPNFAALAHTYGCHGERVETDDDFPTALDRARKSGKPAILDLIVSPEALSTSLKLQS